MTVPQRIWQLLSLTLYSVVVAGVGMYASWPVPLVMGLLCGVPLILLWYESRLPLARLSLGILVGGLIILLLEAVAHESGAWYTVTGSAWRLGGVSVEVALFAFVHVFFYLVLYEYIFDDNTVAARSWRQYQSIMALLAALVITTFYLYVVWVVSFAFISVITLLFVVILALLILSHRGNTRSLFEKAFFFGLVTFPISLTHELVLVESGVRVFAFMSEYVGTVTLFEQSVPVEEMLLLLVWPILLIILYECLLDDAK